MKTERVLLKKLAKANKRIAELEKNEIAFPIRLWAALEAILGKEFHIPTPTQLKVVNTIYEENETIEVNPHEIICIVPVTGRKKIIYLKQNDIIKTYHYNNNDVNFSMLCQQIDPLNRYLLKVSKSAVVNVAYYDLLKGKILQLNITSEELNPVTQIKITDNADFIKIKHGFEYRISLQKKVLGYKFQNGNSSWNNFVT
ncbi:MAG TPA: hypothetical protein VK835_09060 [Bacteroidia bacterium]|jgi:hypothetical protein|nr:hypothetical protein [Bacteroidia bacterium]